MKRSKGFSRFICLCLAALMLTGCASVQGTLSPKPQGTHPEPEGFLAGQKRPEPDPVQALLDTMTTREKVGQLFLVTPEALNFSTGDGLPVTEGPVTVCSDHLRRNLEQYPVGGVILFRQNLLSSDQVSALNAELQSASSIPLFLGVDEEGGRVARIAGSGRFSVPTYQSAQSVGDTGDSMEAFRMGQTIGRYLMDMGFTLDFAPVADVDTNPDNPVIGDRSFSSDPEQAAQMARAMADGLLSEGIQPVFKHFPGHGDTGEDSHTGLAVARKSHDEMAQCEWIPFREATASDFIMVGHVAAPQLTGDMTPATLSSTMVTDLLRGELGFEGVICTDALNMGAITEAYSSGEAALLALEAGCDLLLMPQNFNEAFEAVLSAAESGALSEARLNESVYRILSCKMN